MSEIHVPPEWERLNPPTMTGTVVVIGQSDSGKTTLVRWLVGELCKHHDRVAWLDGDIGQSTLGVPTTMNLAFLSAPPGDALPRPEAAFFVGATSPRGHMLPTVVGVYRLHELARRRGARVIVVDTTGLVADHQGGGALKLWKIALLRPRTVIALQRHGELVHILTPLIREPSVRVRILPVSPQVNRKAVGQRIERRRRRFRAYFAEAGEQEVEFTRLAVYDLERAAPQRLLAFQDRDGFALGLGVITSMSTRVMTVRTPLTDLSKVTSLRIGSVRLDPDTGREIR